jgi:hypothetical protein
MKRDELAVNKLLYRTPGMREWAESAWSLHCPPERKSGLEALLYEILTKRPEWEHIVEIDGVQFYFEAVQP